MMEAKENIIMYNDPNIVEYKTNIEGWVGKDKIFYGKNEHNARYGNSTHKKCECGNIMNKYWTKCEDCRNKESNEKYFKLEFKEWDGKTPVALYNGDEDDFFFDEDAIEDYLDDNYLQPEDLQLVLCETKDHYPELDLNHWEDYFVEDREDLTKDLVNLVDEFNEKLSKLSPNVWFHSNIRTEYKRINTND